jgi:hypothetical protein
VGEEASTPPPLRPSQEEAAVASARAMAADLGPGEPRTPDQANGGKPPEAFRIRDLDTGKEFQLLQARTRGRVGPQAPGARRSRNGDQMSCSVVQIGPSMSYCFSGMAALLQSCASPEIWTP